MVRVSFFLQDDRDRGCELARVRHRELDLPGADLRCPLGSATGEEDTGLRPSAHLDLLPREVDPGAERLADRFLGGEAACVVLRWIRLRVAVGPLCLREAPFLEALAVAGERAADSLDLDQVDADSQELFSSQSGS
jgi:hypothetical protein